MVISNAKACAAFHATNSDEDWDAWKLAAELTRLTEPRVRGTRSLGGGLLTVKNYYLFRR
ncbi:hypothetical protein ACWEVY_28835 [Streptomyces longwoodensis]